MNNTFQILLNWDKGQAFSERLGSKILVIEGYEEIDPQSPIGGPDGTKDILCVKNNSDYLAGCYFPCGQKSFKEIKDKFESDYGGALKHSLDGFIFITNQKITPTERVNLSSLTKIKTTIYHGERVCSILDSPKGYGVRLEYLGIELSKAEQISFLNQHLNLTEQLNEIKQNLRNLNKVTTKLAGEVYSRDINQSQYLSTLPISGIQYSSRLSIEDLFSIHEACMYENTVEDLIEVSNISRGFRKMDVWIGGPGDGKESADFVPATSNKVPVLTFELLEWWRKEYMKVVYGSEEEKINLVAHFHVKFLSIHPFLDGNGRVARVLSSQQLKDLLGINTKFEKIDRADYYKALQKARNGEKQLLNDIFMSLIKE